MTHTEAARRPTKRIISDSGIYVGRNPLRATGFPVTKITPNQWGRTTGTHHRIGVTAVWSSQETRHVDGSANQQISQICRTGSRALQGAEEVTTEDHSLSERHETGQTSSRRAVLATAGTLAGGALAGCSGLGSGSTGTATSTPDVAARSSPFAAISFEAQNLVVELDEGHDVQRVNLIAPDGSHTAKQDVAAGATTVRLNILEVTPSQYEHYEPGTHELVAVSDGQTHTQQLDLRPSLTITGVEHAVLDGQHGYLGVTITNTGTAPTWPYQITYENAPSFTANDSLTDLRGFPQFLKPKKSVDAVLTPGESKIFVSQSQPLIFDEQRENACNGNTVEFTILVGRAVGEPLTHSVQATFNGEQRSVPFQTYFCSEITAKLGDGGDTDA